MRTLASALLLVALAACRIKGDPQNDPAAASCASVGFVCGQNADCCSYACVGATCVPNPVAGGLCRTSDDCVSTMTCVAGQCAPGATCRSINGGPGVGDTCTSNNMCCSGNCVGENNSVYPSIPGSCDVNHPPAVTSLGPVVQPFFASTTLTALASDPDAGDTLQYVWRLQAPIPAGSALTTTWSSSAVHPSVFLDVPGTYVFQVTVKDGLTGQNGRLSASGTVTIDAVNLPPVVNAGADVASLLRNTSLSVSGTVFDPNLGATTVRCAWYAKPPGGAEVLLQAYPSCPSYAPTTGYTATTTFHPGIDEPQGDWTLRLEAFDGQYLTSDTRTVTVVNATPVPVACPGCAAPPYARVVNLRAAGDPTPASLPLSGTATDQNSDVGTPGFTWSWSIDEQDGVALGSPIVLATGDGTAPPFAATFDPSAAGTYLAVLRVDDGHGGSAASSVVVLVEPYLRPLHPLDLGTGLPFGGDVPDATYVHASNRIAYVGSEESSGNGPRLWLLDPESAPTVTTPFAALAHPAMALAVDPDGQSGIVGEAGYFERISLSGNPSTSGSTYIGFTPNEILDAGNREYALAPSGQVYEISSANTPGPASCSTGTCIGTRGAAAQDALWLLDESTGFLRRYTVSPSGRLDMATSVSGLTSSADVWVSALYGTARDAVAGSGARYDATSLAPAAPALPFALRHLDTTAVGTEIRGIAVSSTGAEVRTVGAGWAATAASALPLPAVGYLGTGYPTTARFGFVRTDGSRSYVVLRAYVAGKYRWYLMRY